MINITKKMILIVAGILLSYILGCVGFYIYLKGQNPDVPVLPGSLYYALQMLFLNPPNYGEKMPLTYVLGRSLSAVIFILISGRVIYVLLYKEITNLRLIFRKNHLVICGLGKIGIPIAYQAQKKGGKPVVIIDSFHESTIKDLAKNGIPVVVGNPDDTAVLKQARAAKAKTVLALCDDDDLNISIAYQLNTLDVSACPEKKLECLLFLKSTGLLAAMQGFNVFPHNDPSFNISIRSLNMYAFRARIAFGNLSYTHLSLHEGSGKRPQIILVGFGQMGQSLAIQAAKIAHFPSGGKLQIHVVDEYAKKRIDLIHHNYPNLHQVADIEDISGTLENPDIRKRVLEIFKTAENAGELIACAICQDNENSENLVHSLSLVKELPGVKAPILVYQTSSSGFSQLLAYGSEKQYIQQQLIPFGMAEEIWTFDAIKDEKQDQLAKALHEIYLEGFVGIQRPAWAQLDEAFRESSRASADHIPVKLAAMGLRACPLKTCGDKLVRKLDESHVEILSKMEHARWCAERWLSGWTYGENRDNATRKHPDLVEWDRLKKDRQNIDTRIVVDIPRALGKVHEGIIRNEPAVH